MGGAHSSKSKNNFSFDVQIECCIPYTSDLACRIPPKDSLNHAASGAYSENSTGRLKFTKRREECPVCLEKRLKVELKCGHGLCEGCIKGIIERGPGKLICPLCRAVNV